MKHIEFSYFLFFLLLFSLNIFTQTEPYKLDKFEVKVAVKARVLPIFAIDKKGKPVFDLKKSDLILFVNGKRTKISNLINYKFNYTAKEKKEVYKTVYKKKVKKSERVVFIVFDTIFNSKFGIRRMRKIASSIIESGMAEDSFIIIGIDENKGLFPIIGPTSNKEELIKEINRRKMTSTTERLKLSNRDIDSPTSLLIGTRLFREKKEIKIRAKHFSYKFLYALDDLKRTIELVNKPKVVYVFSTGILYFTISAYKDIREKGVDIIGKLINTIKTLNRSGASMFMINPGRVDSEFDEKNGKMSLKIISRETGGEFFEGTKVKTIIENVKKRTDAYYEMVFYVNSNNGLKNKKTDKIKIVSRNKHIKIYTPKSSVISKKYGDLSPFEKKSYIIGLIEDNKWNSVYGNVQNRIYKRKIKAGNISLNVIIPEELSKKYCDIYKIKLKKNSRNPEIIKISKNTSERELITFDNVSDESLFFVIISKYSPKILVGKFDL